MCGSKTTSQANNSSTYTPPASVLANYNAVTDQAKSVASTPYQSYGGQLVAGVNNQQSTGINAVNSASGIQNGYNAAAAGSTAAATQAIDPNTVTAQQIQNYESPYNSDVINATEASLQNQNQQQAASLQGNSIASGSFGGDRAGVAQAQLAGQQDIANNSTIANLYNQNYSQALGEANTQQSANMTAQQETAQNRLSAGSQLGALGNTAQSEALTEANAQTNAGTLQQTTQQAQDTASYNQFLQQQAYPFETTGWLANIVEGIGSQSGGTSTGTSTTSGSTGGSIAGGLLGLASFLNRGGRVKRASGGGISSYQEQIDPLTGQTLGVGGGTYVPTSNLQIGHTMPNGNGSGGATAQSNGAASNGINDMTSMAKGVQSLGNSFNNSSIGDAFNDFTQDNLGFASGGIVPRRRYDDGGVVPLFDDYGNAPAMTAPDWQTQAAGLTIPPDAVPTAAQYATQMPVPQQLPTPDNALRMAMGASSVAPAAPDPTYGGLASSLDNSAPTSQNDLGIAKLKAAMTPDANSADNATPSPYGNIPLPANMVPTPPTRPIGLGSAPNAGMTALAPGSAANSEAPTDDSIVPIQHTGIGRQPIAYPGSTAGIMTPPAVPSAPSMGNSAVSGVNPNARGMRNNNPGNLVANSWTASLPGYVGSDGRFAIFNTPSDGSAALDRNLQSYGAKGISTPLQIASTWAPGSEKGNDPQSYGSSIASALGVGMNDRVDMADPAVRSKIAGAIAGVENGAGSGEVATAYAGNGQPSQAQTAISSGTQPAGGIAGASNASSVVAPSSGAAPAQSSDWSLSGLLGLNLSPDVRQGMLAAGLGMMSSTSRSPMVQIGQGGLQGIQAMNANRNLASEVGLRGAQTLSSLTQTQNAEIENKIKQKTLDMMMDATSGSGANSNSAPSGNIITAPTITNGSTPALTKQVDPNFDPVLLRDKANRLAMIPAFKDAADKAAAQSAAIMNGEQQVRFTDGTTGYYPGVAEAKAGMAKQTAQAQEEAKVPAATSGEEQKAQLAARTNAWERANEGQTMLQQAQAVRGVLFDPKTGAPNVNTGPLAPTISHVAAIAEQLGINNPTVKMLTGTDPNNAQEVEKFKTALGSETARQDLTGNKVTQSEWNKFLQSVPGEQVLPTALKFLIDKAIIPKAQQQIGAYNAVKGLRPESGDDVQSAYTKYNVEHPWYSPQTESNPTSAYSVPQSAIDYLRKNPSLAPAFDQKYGTGSSRTILGQ